MHFSVDPLEYFPPEITELIFENLSGKDLTNASLVCSSWHQYIAKSKNFTKKIKLNFNCHCEREFFDDTINALTDSERVYENLEIESCSHCLEKIFPLLSVQRWKSVKIQRSNFLNSEQASDFFGRFQKTVEHLEISEVYVKHAYTAGRNKELIFPKLKVFRSKNIQSFLYFDIFANITTLEEFSASSNNQNVASLNAIRELLKVNFSLKKLKISGRLLYQIFYHDISKSSCFKLQEISIENHNHYGEAYEERVYENFTEFLKHQDSLRVVNIDKWMNDSVFQAILELPIVKLHMRNDIPLSCVETWEKIDFKDNPTLENLSIPSFRGEIAKRIINCVPNLKHLMCTYADENFIEYLQSNTKNLQSLSIVLLNIEDYSKFKIFKTVKKLTVVNYLSSMEGRPEDN